MFNPATTILEFIAKDKIEPALLSQIDYLKKENKILRKNIDSLKLTNTEREDLATLGLAIRKLNKELFEQSINIVKPETILRWHRKFVARMFDSSKNRKNVTTKRITKEIELAIVNIAREDVFAGYDKIVGYLEDLGISCSKTTIAKILKKHGVSPVPDRKEDYTWSQFIKAHLEVILACDFFTKEVWTCKGLVTYYIFVFIHLGTRKLYIQGITPYPSAYWSCNQARGFLYDVDTDNEKVNLKYLIRDRGSQYTEEFDNIFKSLNMKVKVTKYPQMNAYCERVIQSIQNECTDRLVFIGENSLKYSLKQYVLHYNEERHHQGIDNIIPFPSQKDKPLIGKVKCKTRLGGLLRSYYREVA
jgi:putative transposase